MTEGSGQRFLTGCRERERRNRAEGSEVDAIHRDASCFIQERLQRFNHFIHHGSLPLRPEGIEALCSDLEVEHTDVRILMLAWKLQSEKQGYFTLEEWRKGLKALRADTFQKLKKALPELEKETQSDYKVINMDQWMGFYRFCSEISFPDFSNYDPELAWPLILDNFVDWMREKQG
nr:DCN1-like protein 4 [Ipomoea batatas]